MFSESEMNSPTKFTFSNRLLSPLLLLLLSLWLVSLAEYKTVYRTRLNTRFFSLFVFFFLVRIFMERTGCSLNYDLIPPYWLHKLTYRWYAMIQPNFAQTIHICMSPTMPKLNGIACGFTHSAVFSLTLALTPNYLLFYSIVHSHSSISRVIEVMGFSLSLSLEYMWMRIRTGWKTFDA